MLEAPPPLPSLVSIRAFEAAARLGGFARAATELGTTAASVSYHVRQLERQTGVIVFERRAQGVVLTEAGAEIAAECARFFTALRATFVRAGSARDDRLSVSTLPTLGASWLTPRLGRFQALHPGLTVAVELTDSPRELGAGWDAAIRHGAGDWPGLRAVRLFPCVFQPLCAPALRDAARTLADPANPPAVPLLGRPDWWQRWYAALGHPDADLANRFRTALATEHLDAAAAIAGQGITIGSPILFADDIANGRLVPAHDLIAGDGCDFWFVHPIGRTRHRATLAFRDWLTTEADRALAGVPGLPPSPQSVLSAPAS